MNEKDIRMDLYVRGDKISMTLIHLPTGVWVSSDGISRHRLYEELKKQLEEKVES